MLNFVLEYGRLNYEIESILVKCQYCSLIFLSKHYDKRLGAMAGLAAHKSASGLGLHSRRLVSCPRTKSWRRR